MKGKKINGRWRNFLKFHRHARIFSTIHRIFRLFKGFMVSVIDWPLIGGRAMHYKVDPDVAHDRMTHECWMDLLRDWQQILETYTKIHTNTKKYHTFILVAINYVNLCTGSCSRLERNAMIKLTAIQKYSVLLNYWTTQMFGLVMCELVRSPDQFHENLN